MKAREWLERGKRAADPINALSDFWRGFNHVFFPLAGDNEKAKIRKLLIATISEQKAQAILAENAQGVEVLLAQPVIDMRGNGRNTKPNIDAFKATGDSLGKLQEIFMMIYQIRCNLEHGQKSPSRERDVQLCEASSPIVAAVLAICV
jgi:hypothetical protein